MKNHKRQPLKNVTKVVGAAYKTSNTLKKNSERILQKEKEFFLTTPKTFDNPSVKGSSEKGKAEQENTRLMLHLCPPRLGGGIRASLHGRFVTNWGISGWGDRENDKRSSSRLPGPDGGIHVLSGPRGVTGAGHCRVGAPAPAQPSPRMSSNSSAAIFYFRKRAGKVQAVTCLPSAAGNGVEAVPKVAMRSHVVQ